MNRDEFTDNLRRALNGRIPVAYVEENVRYYSDYINTQIRMGKTEDQVMEDLGDPRLIAKTIVQAAGGEANGRSAETAYEEGTTSDYGYGNSSNRGGAYSGYDNDSGGDFDEYEDSYAPQSRKEKFLNWCINSPRWLKTTVGVILGAGIIWLILSVLSFLAPVLIPLCVIMLIVKLARDGL